MNSRLSRLLSLPLLTTIVLTSACSPVAQHHSVTKEQIDSANDLISIYGLSRMPTYEELLEFPSVQTKDDLGNPKLPWTDTYWPTIHKNLAARWGFINSRDEANQNPYSDFKLGAYFQSQLDALAASDKELPINLSPGEKFDIAFRSLNKLVLNNKNPSFQKLTVLDGRHDEFSASSVRQANHLKAKRALVGEYLGALNSASSREESLNYLSPLATEGYTAWLFSSQQNQNKFPGEGDQGMDWSWEGICHGWAPAAVMAAEPKHSVQVVVQDPESKIEKNLLFTEGDIRALLDKSWADAKNQEQFFIGRRCEKNLNDPSLGVPNNAEGRGVTGSMYYKTSAGNYLNGAFTIVQDYPRRDGSTALYRVILEDEWNTSNPRYAFLLELNESGNLRYQLTYDQKAAFAEFEGTLQTVEGSLTIQDASNVEIHGCWDVNPASFHTVLVENIGKKNLGFVMDRTQSAQVWNQPIGKADFTIGELKAVGDLSQDIARYYRAPGTAYVAEVTAIVYWAAEPSSPRFSYAQDGEDFDQTQFVQSTYHYTLEFDANKKLVGGEWGTFQSFRGSENPDFLFGFSSQVEPNLDSAAPYMKEGYPSIIKKIHECSLSDRIDGEITVNLTNGSVPLTQTLSYSTCSL